MEIITFDHKVYQDLNDKIQRIAEYVFSKEKNPAHRPEIWLTSEELAELLKVSTRTLQRMRKERTIPLLYVTQQMCLPPFRCGGVHIEACHQLQSSDS